MLNNEKRYLISRFVNLIGNSIYNICIPLYLLEKFESLMITGAFFTLVQIPMVVLLPFIGSFLKNKNLKHTMLASNVISVVIFVMVFINEQFFSSSFILFMILTMLEKINVAIFNISSQSAFPILFEKKDIDEINSLKSVLDNFAALLGPTLGTVIYSKGGFSVVVGINILSFALCFLMLLHLKYIDKCGPSIQKKNKIKDIYEGLVYIKSNSNIMLLFLTL
ncbi:MAG: MFS transporter [Clostridia bacterium]